MPKARPADPNELTTSEIAERFSDEGEAWKLVERLRWPEGPACPHCGTVGVATHLAAGQGARTTSTGRASHRRIWQCNSQPCRKQFSVLVGTVMEDSKIPLSKWLLAMHLLCAGKNGVSAHELHRTLGITYKSAWFMAHRIRYAMAQPAPRPRPASVVEADETYIGGKNPGGKRGCGPENKVPVFTLVERNGEARSQMMRHVTGENIGARKTRDGERAERVFAQIAGKRLMHRDSLSAVEYVRIGPNSDVR